jgi:hypothetical protein
MISPCSVSLFATIHKAISELKTPFNKSQIIATTMRFDSATTPNEYNCKCKPSTRVHTVKFRLSNSFFAYNYAVVDNLSELKKKKKFAITSAVKFRCKFTFAKFDTRSNTLSNISIYFHIRKTFSESVSFNNIRKTAKPDAAAV